MTDTLMRFAYCPHCGHRDRLADDAEGVPRMCNGCGHLGSYRLIGVTEPEIADQLRAEFPEPTVDEIGRPT
jgi:hypothetical protein